MSYEFHDLAGNIGVAVLLISYLALQHGSLRSEDWRFSAANAVGAGLVLWSLSFDFNLSAFIIESCWLIVSLYGLLRARARAQQER